MIKMLCSLLLAAGQAYAFDLPATDAAAVRVIAADTPAAPAAKPASQRLWMSVTNNLASKEAQANDWANRISAQVRDTGTGRFDVNLRTDAGYAWASINKYGGSYNFFGSGMNLYMSGSGNSHFMSGNFTENGKSYYVGLNLNGASAFSGNLFGNGANLFISPGSISGWFDEERLPGKAVAAAAAFVLTLQLEAEPQREAPALSSRAEDQEIFPLFERLSSPDAAVRVQAARALRQYDTDARVQARLAAVIADANEEETVRIAALKSIAWALFDKAAVKTVMDCAEGAGNSPRLRGLATRALYARAAAPEVRKFLVDKLESGDATALRAASAWTLFPLIDDAEIKKVLFAWAAKEDAPVEVRVECLKTVFDLMGSPEAAAAARALAADTAVPAEVRRTAILCLSRARKDAPTTELLERLAAQEPDERLRDAAVKASGGLNMELAHYFQWTRWHHQFIDPIAMF